MTIQLLDRISKTESKVALTAIRNRAYIALQSGAIDRATYNEIQRFVVRQTNYVNGGKH